MRLIFSLLALSIMAAYSVELPHTLGGLAPGENINAYVGILGYPSTQVQVGTSSLWNWGEGLMAKIDINGSISEVIVIRAGKQRELSFDIGDDIQKAVIKLGKSNITPKEVELHKYIWQDEKSKLILSVDVDSMLKIERITLAIVG